MEASPKVRKKLWKPEWWEILALVIGVVLILWFGSCRFLVPTLNISLGACLSSSKILDKVKNLDLLFFTGTSQGERAIRVWHSSYYSHVCIVVRDDNTPGAPAFIWESDLGHKYKDGPRLMRLSEKLERWKGDKIGMWRRYIPSGPVSGNKPSAEDILKIVQEYLKTGAGMDINMLSWFLSDYPDTAAFRFLKGNNVFCSELVAGTLQKLGILPKDKNPSWYTPDFFSKPLNVKGNYGTPVYFSF